MAEQLQFLQAQGITAASENLSKGFSTLTQLGNGNGNGSVISHPTSQPPKPQTPRREFWDRREFKPNLSDLHDPETTFDVQVTADKQIDFSLYYFGSYGAEFKANKYSLLLEGAKFGDRHGFSAVWLPERHFHEFGGFSPNPSILSATLAGITDNIHLRAGSVVLPIHHPVRVAEDWAIIDNISQGRVGISFASGWHPNDFIFAPDAYDERREIMFEGIETVQKLWQGESIKLLNGSGKPAQIRTFPMPKQSKLPVWVTIVNNPDTYIRAGAMGVGVLTNLMGQSTEDLSRNIGLYRESLSRHGHDPSIGQVTVLLHTFVKEDAVQAQAQARQPFKDYLTSSIGLFKALVKSQGLQMTDFDSMSEDDKDYMLSVAYDRYVETSALIGSPESCRKIVDQLRAIGIDEIACLIDFGVEADDVLANLPHLQQLKEQVNRVNLDDWLYRLTWQPLPLQSQTNKLVTQPGHWLIFADQTGLATALANQLQQQGHTFTLLYLQGNGVSVGVAGNILDPSDPDAFQSLLKQYVQPEARPLHGILHLWSLDSPIATKNLTSEVLSQTQEQLCGSVLHLVLALSATKWSGNTPKLWIITQNAISLQGEAPNGLAQSSLWGFGRVICSEHPDYWGGLIDLDSQNYHQIASKGAISDRTDQVLQLLSELEDPEENQVALHNGQRYVARLQRSPLSSMASSGHGQRTTAQLHLGGTCLITGGLGALGMRLAEWLAQQGVRHLVLCGRSTPSTQIQGRIMALRTTGIQVWVAQVDVSQRSQLENLLTQLQADSTFPPLQGVFHLAGLLDDAALFQQTWPRFAKVLAPKVLGTWNLHQLTEQLPLQYFVIFSSIASILGSPGQSNHAAANAFIDALAQYRQALGLPIHSFNWGSWSEVGKVTRMEGAQQQRWKAYFENSWRAMGMEPIAINHGFQALEQLLNQANGSLGVFRIDWPRFHAALGTAQTPFFQNLSQNTALKPASTSQDILPHRFPLSDAQKQLWVLAQMVDEGAIAYNDNINLELRGSLRLDALNQAVQWVVDRHESLRTHINPNGEWQEIQPTMELVIPIIDLSAHPEPDAESLVWLRERSQQPITLGTDPLFHVELLKLSAEHHILVITVHHIISDGWSLENILKEISLAYSALSRKETASSDLSDELSLATPLQFREFLSWQQQQGQTEAMIAHQDFWIKQFQSITSNLDLPSDRPRPAVKTYHGGRQTHRTEPILRQQLRQFSQEQGCTLFMTLLATYFVFLHRLSRQEDIVVGIPTAGRFLSGSETLIGYVTHLLPIASNFDGNQSFLDHLTNIRQSLLAAYEHQAYPFAKLLKQLNLKGDRSRTPLVSVTFNLEPPIPPISLGDLETTLAQRPVSFTHFDLHFIVIDMGDHLMLEAKYNTDLFNQETIERWLGHFQTLLESVVATPNKATSRLAWLSPAECNRLLVDWNPDSQTRSSEASALLCVHQQFEQQVLKTPEATAVVSGEQQLTYQALNQQANQLAHRLQALGICPDSPVLIYTERSVQTIVAILATFKAGGAYVAIEATNPAQRVAAILTDLKPAVVLTQTALVHQLPSEFSSPIIKLDQDWLEISQAPDHNPANEVQLDHLAYIIFTSGSTGKPKGVAIEHRHLAYYLQSIIPQLNLEPGLQFASVSTFSADLGHTVVFPALCSGGTLHVLSQEQAMDPQAFARYCHRQPIDILKIVPTHLESLLQVNAPEAVLPQRTLVLGGDILPWDLVTRVQSLAPTCRILNHYGPSETTVGVLTHNVAPNQPSSGPGTVPLGEPLPHAQVYVLDPYLQPVPVGVPGELYIGGESVGRGYLAQPDLTAEYFIQRSTLKEVNSQLENSSTISKRVYKTGDLVRWSPTGQVEFLGRIDQQVKIRGFRVELGEVETVLMDHENVQHVIVVTQESQSGDRRLVAYWVSHQQTATEETLGYDPDFRGYLQTRLPEYMVPSAFVRLDALPLTANGKIDRQALPVPDFTVVQDRDFVAPRTPTEQAIADIFATVLGLESVGIHHHFFDLGGHSLLATQVISRLRATFQVELSLRTLFEVPTVAGLDLVIRQELQRSRGEITPDIGPRPQQENMPLPLSWAQERLWFLEELEGARATYNMIGAARLTGRLQVDALEKTLGTIVQRHEVLRTGLENHDGIPVQVISPDAHLRLHQIDLQDLPEQEHQQQIEHAIAQESKTPFNLAQPPLIRAVLLRLAPEDHVLLVTMHHIASDGWSVSLVMVEITSLYRAFVDNQPSPLPPLTIQYADFAIWQRQWLSGELLQKQLQYWKKQLSGELSPLRLSLDYALTQPSDEGAMEVVELPTVLMQGLKALGNQEGSTLYMIFVAAFNVLLSRHTGQDDLVIGMPIAGRNQLGSEDLIGFFVNTLPLRTDLSGNPTFTELLTRVREVTLDAYSHQDIPFEKLVEELQPVRSLYRNPLFDVVFNFVNTPRGVVKLPNLTVKRIECSDQYSKFWFTVYVREIPGSLKLEWVYRRNLFAPQRIQIWLNQLVNLLQQVVAQPQLPIQAYSLVASGLLKSSVQTVLPNPSTPLSEPTYELATNRFETWVTQTPDHIAISQEDRSWTYRQLSKATSEIAQHLLQVDIHKGDVVAIYGPRSFGLIASLLAVAQTGGVMMLVDPNLPLQRQQAMLSQADARYCLHIGTQPLPTWELPVALNTINLDADSGQIQNSAIHRVTPCSLPQVLPDDAAYIFFTSGSTGTPKGILGSHKGIAHFVAWQQETFNVIPGDRVAQLIGLTFDALLRDVFLPLTSGATLCLPYQDYYPGSPDTLPWLEQEQITLLHTVPAVAHAWLQTPSDEITLNHLRYMFCSGEPLTDTLIQQWRTTFPAAGQIVNLYGATETTMVKSFYPVPEQLVPGIQPGGWPLPDTQLLVFNPNQQPCGIGEVGEIVVRTPFRTLGYLDAQSTSPPQPFIVNPFNSDDPQDLLYYTGDRGRYRLDGTIEILGRLDNQIKIRGVRIQLGEIESLLNQHATVRTSIVSEQKDPSGEQFLAAYVVPKSGQTISIAELRQFLTQQLPDYAIPTAIVTLEALPLTATGKVDRNALPAASKPQETTEESVAPRTEVETKLAALVAQVLKRESVGITDNFFELGGHSLLATQVVSRLQKTFQVKVSLRQMFKDPTVAGLAKAIEQLKKDPSLSDVRPKIRKINRAQRRIKSSKLGESSRLKQDSSQPD